MELNTLSKTLSSWRGGFCRSLLFSIVLVSTGIAEEVETLTLPIRFHLTEGVTMKLKGQTMDSWVTPEAIENEVLPEINRIWKPAHIRFVIELCRREPLLQLPDRAELINFVENSKRGADQKMEHKRITSIRKLFDPAGFHPTALNVYLFPFVGSTYQGFARLSGKHAVVGMWSDKSSGGKTPPVKVLLVEPEPFKVGSLARTIAHELGHNLGLQHPSKDMPHPTPRLMGGKLPGYGLTPQEIERARSTAREHGATVSR